MATCVILVGVVRAGPRVVGLRGPGVKSPVHPVVLFVVPATHAALKVASAPFYVHFI